MYEVGEERGAFYLASEFVPGETVKAVIAGQQLNSRRAAELAIQLADALAEAHAHGTVHGGLRPDTVIVTPKGQAKLLDLGLTEWVRPAAPAASEASAAADGDSGGRSDPRRDLAALGSVLYEMLTGHVPDPTKPAPPAVMRAIPTEFDPIMLKVLSPDLNENYQSAATLAADLRAVTAVLGEKRAKTEATAPRVQPRPAAAAARVSQPANKKKSGIGWMVAVAVIAALLALVWLATQM
jgi:serine/threonine protein kinase